MLKTLKDRLLNKPSIKKSILLFLFSFIIFLIIWANLGPYYSYSLVYLSSVITAKIKNITLIEIIPEKDLLTVIFSSPIRNDLSIFKIILSGVFTFTTPLTIAIFTALLPDIEKRKKALLELIAILLLIHFLQVFSQELYKLTYLFAKKGFESPNKMFYYLLQYFSVFMENMIIRFEPFLLGLYVFFRFRKKTTYQEAS